MICKVCGKELKKRERFCPYCQSYFIDASDPAYAKSEGNGIAWFGQSRGQLKDYDKKDRIWGIVALSVASAILFFNILYIIIGEPELNLLNFPLFIFAVVASMLGKASRYFKLVWIFLIISTFLTFWGFSLL